MHNVLLYYLDIFYSSHLPGACLPLQTEIWSWSFLVLGWRTFLPLQKCHHIQFHWTIFIFKFILNVLFQNVLQFCNIFCVSLVFGRLRKPQSIVWSSSRFALYFRLWQKNTAYSQFAPLSICFNVGQHLAVCQWAFPTGWWRYRAAESFALLYLM